MQKRLFLLIFCLVLTLPLSAQDNREESDSMPDPQILYTYHQATGNRFVEGSGTFPAVDVIDYQLTSVPQWILGTPEQWYVTMQDGQFLRIEEGVSESLLNVAYVMPLLIDGLTTPRANDGSLWSHSVWIGDNLFVDISDTGDLILLADTTELSRLALNIQADARIVVSDDGRIAVYANATNQRYVHGIMGDDIEGASLVILEIVDDALEIIGQIDLEGDAVYEGLSPLWADVNQDAVQDLITTVSDSRSGSRIRAYLFTDNGTVTVEGQAIGQANRWQHQLAWGAFGVNGEMQLVDVLTPHIGGVVRFYEFTGTELSIVSQLRGYTSHVIGSRNLDMAVAGDFDGDGQPEIVLPSQDRSRIAGIANTGNGAQVVWELPLDGTLVTNLAAVNTENGLVLAAGRSDGTVRLWLPQS